jgi:streptogramin lyase
MPIRSPLPAAIAALLCISLPAGGQDHTPDRARKTGTIAPTSVGVSFKEWTVPTPRSFPHDPLAAADGAIWYTGQMASTLGRLDPKTGAFKRISDEDARLGSTWTGCR